VKNLAARAGAGAGARVRALAAGTARALAGLLALAATMQAAAHDARPLSIAIVEQGDDLYRAVVRAPPTVDAGNAPRILWPEACEILQSAPLAQAPGSMSLVRCAGGLANRTIRVDYPLYNPSLTTLFRVEPADDAPVTAVLPPDELAWLVPPEPTFFTVARDYLALGFKHIWEGPDHLLFVAGLMLLARGARRIFWAVTGFTAAHSITLSLSTLGVVRLAVEPVEAMIALSILFLAAEIARNDATSFSSRFPVALSFVFGLLHGFGFASALGEIGLPRGELAAGLAFFNVGVELGQLAFIAAAALLVLAWRSARQRGQMALRTGPPTGPVPTATGTWRPALVGAYALGIPAAYWCIERTVAAFGA
jgi:hydrogenase/urease accessory protein HupE